MKTILILILVTISNNCISQKVNYDNLIGTSWKLINHTAGTSMKFTFVDAVNLSQQSWAARYQPFIETVIKYSLDTTVNPTLLLVEWKGEVMSSTVNTVTFADSFLIIQNEVSPDLNNTQSVNQVKKLVFKRDLPVGKPLAANANNQRSVPTNVIGKKFVSRSLEYLEIINDSTLYSSINSYTDTANFFLRNDTLFIHQRHLQTDQTGTNWMNKLYNYKVFALTGDTIKLKNGYSFYKPHDWEDTLFFTNVEKLKEPVQEFIIIKLDFDNPWSGTQHISIDNLGRVIFKNSPLVYSADFPHIDKSPKPKSFRGQLTPQEFSKFKKILSTSLPSRLPFRRSCNAMDGAVADFDISIGTKIIKSTGCELSWIHAFLLNYLVDIHKNKGVIKKTRL